MNFRMKASLAILFFSSQVTAGTCHFTNLSIKYNYQLTREETNKINDTTVSTVSLTVSDKLNQKTKQVLSFIQSDEVLPAFTCTARSYLTDYNIKQPAIDGYYGDIIIADLNFDGRDDIAIASEFTNGFGQLYKFYFQDAEGHFTENTNFISPQIEAFAYPFPTTINPETKTLTFTTRDGALNTFSATYQLNEESGKWVRLANNTEKVKKQRKVTKSKRKYLVESTPKPRTAPKPSHSNTHHLAQKPTRPASKHLAPKTAHPTSKHLAQKTSHPTTKHLAQKSNTPKHPTKIRHHLA